MDRLLNLLGRRTTLLSLFFATLFFNFLLSYFMPKDYALDLKFAYTYWEAIHSIAEMDLETRNLYKAGIWMLDFPYLLVYSFFFLGLMYRLFGKQAIIYIPLFIGLVDIFENILVMSILNTFPTVSHLLVLTASFFTTFKWILVGVLGISVIVGVIRFFATKKISMTSKSEVKV